MILMLAFCGALVTMPAQTKTKSDRTKKEGSKTEQGIKNEGMPWEDGRRVIRKPPQKDKAKEGEKTGITTMTYTPMPTPEDKTAVKVPLKVKQAFTREHKEATAHWKQQGENYKAHFKSNGKDRLETIIVYDKDGNILIVQRQLKNDVCPLVVAKYCTKNERIWEVDSKGEPRRYFIQEKGEPVKWYDSRGNRIYGTDDTYGVIYRRSDAE